MMNEQLSKDMNTNRTVDFDNSEAVNSSCSWPYERVQAFSGKYVTRLCSSIFYWGALLSFITGIILLANDFFIGASLIITLSPFLLLYPLIRFLFGGKDSVVVVIITAIVEEIIKEKISKSLDNSSRKKK